MTPGHPDWAARLRSTRRAAGLTQAALASKIGITQSSIADYERGKAALTLPRLKQIAEALGVHMDTFLSDSFMSRDDAPKKQDGPAEQSTDVGAAAFEAYEDKGAHDYLFAGLCQTMHDDFIAHHGQPQSVFDLAIRARAVWGMILRNLPGVPMEKAVQLAIELTRLELKIIRPTK